MDELLIGWKRDESGKMVLTISESDYRKKKAGLKKLKEVLSKRDYSRLCKKYEGFYQHEKASRSEEF